MKERKQAALQKIRVIKMIGLGETQKNADDKKRVEMILGEIGLLEKLIIESL